MCDTGKGGKYECVFRIVIDRVLHGLYNEWLK